MERRWRPWCNSLHHAGLAALVISGQLLSMGMAGAHDGHDHDSPPPPNLPVAPDVTAVTPDNVLVGALTGEQRLTISSNG
jgi:hypothetical protein